MKRIIKSVATVTAFSFATRTLSFFYRMILSRNLTSSELGIYQITLSVFMVLISVTSSGLPLAISKITSENSKNRNVVSRTASSGILIGTIFSLLSAFLLICFRNILSPIFAEKDCYPLLLSLLPALLASSFYSSFRGSLWGEGRFFEYSLIELVDECISLFALVSMFYFFAFDVQNLFIPSIAISVSYVFSAILSSILYFKKGGRLRLPRAEMSRTLKVASPITFVRVLSSFSSSILALLLPSRLVVYGLSRLGALELVGLVNGIALPLLFVPSSLIGSLALVLVPELASDSKKGLNVTDKIKTSLTFSAIVTSVLIPCYIALGKELCGFLFLKAEAGIYLSVAAITMLPMCLNQLTVSFLNSIGGEKFGFRNFLVGGSIAVLCVIFLTPYIGIYSIILSMFAQSVVVFTLNARNISKIVGTSFFSIFSKLKPGLIIIPGTIIAFATRNLTAQFGLFFNIVLVGIVTVAFVVGVFFAFTKKPLKSYIEK